MINRRKKKEKKRSCNILTRHNSRLRVAAVVRFGDINNLIHGDQGHFFVHIYMVVHGKQKIVKVQ